MTQTLPYIITPEQIRRYLESRGIVERPRGSVREFVARAKAHAAKGVEVGEYTDMDSTNYKNYLYGR